MVAGGVLGKINNEDMRFGDADRVKKKEGGRRRRIRGYRDRGGYRGSMRYIIMSRNDGDRLCISWRRTGLFCGVHVMDVVSVYFLVYQYILVYQHIVYHGISHKQSSCLVTRSRIPGVNLVLSTVKYSAYSSPSLPCRNYYR